MAPSRANLTTNPPPASSQHRWHRPAPIGSLGLFRSRPGPVIVERDPKRGPGRCPALDPQRRSRLGSPFYRQTLLGVSTRLKKGFGPLSKGGSWVLRAGDGKLATGTSNVSEIDEQEPEMETHRLSVRKAA
jgi:hypothetical protein